jgi:hypothetical protein
VRRPAISWFFPFPSWRAGCASYSAECCRIPPPGHRPCVAARPAYIADIYSMRERPKSRDSFASLVLMATYVFLVRPRTHSPNPVQLQRFFKRRMLLSGSPQAIQERVGSKTLRTATRSRIPVGKSSVSPTLSMGLGKCLPDIDSDPRQCAQAVADREQDERHEKIV